MNRLLCVLAGTLVGSIATAGLGLAGGATAQDAVKVSPQLYTVKLENEHVRVLEYVLKPGQTEPVHSHPSYVVYFLGDARIRATAADGTTTDSVATQGQTAWRDPLTHRITNIGTTDVKALIVDVKARSGQ